MIHVCRQFKLHRLDFSAMGLWGLQAFIQQVRREGRDLDVQVVREQIRLARTKSLAGFTESTPALD